MVCQSDDVWGAHMQSCGGNLPDVKAERPTPAIKRGVLHFNAIRDSIAVENIERQTDETLRQRLYARKE